MPLIQKSGTLFYFLTSGVGDDDNNQFYILENELRTNAIFDFYETDS